MQMPEEKEDSYACFMFAVSWQFLWQGCEWFWVELSIPNYVTLVIVKNYQ
jgi:hypothetical protein